VTCFWKVWRFGNSCSVEAETPRTMILLFPAAPTLTFGMLYRFFVIAHG
jgi:hypothetical protein